MGESYNKTNYPNIYKHTYWGNFDYEKNKYSITKNIIDNRNKFIEEYNVKIKKNPPQYISKEADRNLYRFFDHVEFYQNEKFYIIIISPYNHLNEIDLNKLKELEFQSIYQLYSINAFSFVKIIPKKN